jgi:TRAP-type transport system periplasmic protein
MRSAPHVALTKHAITVRPLAFANATYQRLDEELQGCIDEAGIAAGKLGRDTESGEDSQKLQAMIDQGWITTHEFEGRERLRELAEPVMQAYAEELGALEVYEAIAAVE